jgi:cytoskeleton protein RodZ
VFEIGNSLREARLRQQLDFPEIEQATKIRSKYLRALESEQFELLPGQTYVKGFLSTYAEFLGLDGQLYVDEFNSRYVTGEEETAVRPRRSAVLTPRNRRFESNMLIAALTGIAVVTALVFAAARFGGEDETAIPNLEQLERTQPPAVPKRTSKPKRTRPVQAHLVLTAVNGDCWIQVRQGANAAGKEKFQGTLEPGDVQRFTAKSLWINIGAPGNLSVRLNGKPRRLPGEGYPRQVIVTAKGIRLAQFPT